MQRTMASVRRVPTLAEALRGLVAFLLLVGISAGIAAALLYAGERPGLPREWPSWTDVEWALAATEPPLEGTRYVVSMIGWVLLTYIAVVVLLQAAAGTLVSISGGATWAREISRAVDLVTLPWVKRGASGGLMAAVLVASLVKASPELPHLSFGRAGSASGAGTFSMTAGVEAGAPGVPASVDAAPVPVEQETVQSLVQHSTRPELPAPVAGVSTQSSEEEEAVPADTNVTVSKARLPGPGAGGGSQGAGGSH